MGRKWRSGTRVIIKKMEEAVHQYLKGKVLHVNEDDLFEDALQRGKAKHERERVKYGLGT